MVREKGKRLQSAIEYLISYAWLFLVLAIVLAALYWLGVFNSNFGVRASPGSCYISRPYGPNTTKLIALAGLCNNEIPEFVVGFFSQANFFHIVPGPVVTGNAETMTAWIYVISFNSVANPAGELTRSDIFVIEGGGGWNGGAGGRLSINNDSDHELDYAMWTGTQGNLYGNFAQAVSPNNAIALGTWYFVAGTYNGAALNVYINSTLVGTAAQNGPINQDTYGPDGPYLSPGSQAAIGAFAPTTEGYYHGFISNVQLYNASLSQSELRTLFYEGIGGVPIDIQNLISWYPLNGNGNDYSGNGANGGPTNVIYNEQVLNYYSSP